MDYSGGGGKGAKGMLAPSQRRGGRGQRGMLAPSQIIGGCLPPPPSSYAYEINFFSSFSTGENLFVCFLC